MCTAEDKNTDALFRSGPDVLQCDVGCFGDIGSLEFFCTDFSLLEDWVTGGRSTTYNIGSTDYFEVL